MKGGKRAVLDTNVLVSAVLFGGRVARLHSLWKQNRFTMVASKKIVEEYLRVLSYPKFGLTEDEIKNIFHEEILPYIEPVIVKGKTRNICKDPDDDKFLECAAESNADFIISGDDDLLRIKEYHGCPIVTPEKFLRGFRQ